MKIFIKYSCWLLILSCSPNADEKAMNSTSVGWNDLIQLMTNSYKKDTNWFTERSWEYKKTDQSSAMSNLPNDTWFKYIDEDRSGEWHDISISYDVEEASDLVFNSATEYFAKLKKQARDSLPLVDNVGSLFLSYSLTERMIALVSQNENMPTIIICKVDNYQELKEILLQNL